MIVSVAPRGLGLENLDPLDFDPLDLDAIEDCPRNRDGGGESSGDSTGPPKLSVPIISPQKLIIALKTSKPIEVAAKEIVDIELDSSSPRVSSPVDSSVDID